MEDYFGSSGVGSMNEKILEDYDQYNEMYGSEGNFKSSVESSK